MGSVKNSHIGASAYTIKDGPVLKRDDAHCPTIFLVGCLEVGGNLEAMLNQGGIVFDGGGAQVAQTERRARR